MKKTAATLLGHEPDLVLTWEALSLGGVPEELRQATGVYVARVAGMDGYIGRSKVLCYRLGQFLGDLLAGYGGKFRDHVHSGATRIRNDGTSPRDVELWVFLGEDAYTKEAMLIREVDPPFNGKAPSNQRFNPHEPSHEWPNASYG